MRMVLVNKRSKHKNKIKKYLFFVFIFLILIIYLFYKISFNIGYYYLNYSVRKANIIIEDALSSSVSDKVLNDIKDINVYTITKSSSGDIEMIDYNSYFVNVFLRDVSDSVVKALHNYENNSRKIAFYVPLGVITKNPIFNDFGPKIPVKMEVVGSVLSNVNTKVKSFGINNCLIEMTINVTVSEKIILPVMSKTITVSNEIPISYKIIKGNIPSYYGNSIDKTSSIYSLPIE